MKQGAGPMKPAAERYFDILRAVVFAGEADAMETHLADAFELGRALVAQGVPPDEVAHIHHEGVVRLSRQYPDLTLAQVADRLNTPLLEADMAYGLAFREQMEQRYQALVASQHQHQSRMEATGTLAAGIAHDFNNILGSIVGFAEMVGDELAADSAEKHGIQQILIASFRARDLIARMLTFARQNQGNHLLPMDAISQIREALALLKGSCAPDLEITFKTDVECAMVLAESGQLQQIVMNLCINAADAMNYRGVIAIHVAPVEFDDGLPGVCLRVADSGHGMTPEVQERIFDPFFTTKAPSKGSGLGLSVVYGIVRQLGGLIKVQSRAAGSDHGTEFSVLLRLAAIPAEETAIGRPPPNIC